MKTKNDLVIENVNLKNQIQYLKREVVLSNRRIQVHEWLLKKGPQTTEDITDAGFAIRIESACTILKHMYDLGYCTRLDEGAPSGGKQFVYTASWPTATDWIVK